MIAASLDADVLIEPDPTVPGLTIVRRRDEPLPVDARLWDIDGLERDGRLTGKASGGRGNTVFLDWYGEPLVMREYRRGGLPSRLSERHYVRLGASRSRPLREFVLLCRLQALGLPAPIPVAGLRMTRGLLERGALVMRRLPGETLAERLIDGRIDDAALEAVGRCIARFHRAGVRHPDLNAHNVLLDGDGPSGPSVAVIDFDRGELKHRANAVRHDAASAAELDRLERSLVRLVGAGEARALIAQLREGWQAP